MELSISVQLPQKLNHLETLFCDNGHTRTNVSSELLESLEDMFPRCYTIVEPLIYLCHSYIVGHNSVQYTVLMSKYGCIMWTDTKL